MSRITTATKSAIFLLAVLLVLLAISFLPFGNDGSSHGGNEKSALLLQQIAAVDNLPPAVEAKIDPAVKDAIKEALYLAAAAKTNKEREEKEKVTVVIKVTAAKDIKDEIAEAGGKVTNKVSTVDGDAELLAVEVDAGKVVEIAKEAKVAKVYPKVTYEEVLDQSVPLIKADAFWNTGFKGNGIRVAVLDTGIDKAHPMLQGRVVAEKDFSKSGSADDKRGHGTHVAGIIAGTKATGGKYSGVAPEAQLLNAKVLDDTGYGEDLFIVAAIGWVLNPDGDPSTSDGAKVISMSLGSKVAMDSKVEEAIKSAVAKGAVVVVASGNCGPGCGSGQCTKCSGFKGVMWPGNSPSVITVGAVDNSKNVAYFSGGGVVDSVGIKPDFVAPGVDIKSAYPGGLYVASDGTSMATPHVSGAVALLLGKSPGLNQGDVSRILEKTALDLGNPGKDISYGFGLIDLAKALIYKEGLEVSVEVEKQVISGSAQKITVKIYDDVTVNSVKATITKPNNAKTDVTFSSSSGNVYTYDFTDTALMGNYVVDVAVNYGGTSGSSGTGSEGGGEAGSGSDGSASITVTRTAYFKVTSLTGDFGNVEEISISQQQKLSSNLTGTLMFVNTAGVELNFSALLQLLDNLTVVQEIRPATATVAANSKATVAVNNQLEVGPGNYTIRILTDYGAGSLVNETNITVADDLVPQILNLTHGAELTNDNPLILIAKVSDHSSLSNISLSVEGKKPPCPAGFSCILVVSPPFAVAVNYSVKTISQSARESEIAATVHTVFSDKYDYKAQLKVCDDYGSCTLSDAVNFSMKTPTECVDGRDPAFIVIGEENRSVMGTCTALCSGKKLLAAKTYEAKSVFEEAAASDNSLCLSVLNMGISGTPATGFLEKFDAVVWSTGTDLVNIGSSDAAALADYYGKKGKVVVEGSDVAFRHGSDEFMGSVLHAQLKTDLGFTVASVANMSSLSINVTRQHPVVYGLSSQLPFNATVDPFPDAIAVANGGVELAAWSGLDTKGTAIVAYESEGGDKKSLLLPFSIAALNGSDAKAIATSALKWLLEDSAVDVMPLEIKYGSGGEYPLITRKIGPYCPMVCREMWELKNGICSFTNCGSGCGADNTTTFMREAECELAKQYYEGGSGSGVIVEGKEFTASAIVESTEKLASPPRVKVLVDGGANGASEGGTALIPATTANYSYNFSTMLGAGQHTLTVFANSDLSISEKNYVNNIKDFSLVVYPKLPDLRFGAMAYSYDNATGLIAVNLSVSNLGGAAASSTLKTYVDGKEAATAAFELSATETKQVKLEFTSQKGAYDFKAALDPGNKVQEHNESNNELSQKIYLCSKEKVLVVDDNDAAFFSTPEPSSSDEFLDILRKDGYCVEVWDEKLRGVPSSSDLSGFKAVIWTAGDYFNGTISNDDAQVIGNFSGGLLLEGSDVGLDDAGGGFLQGIAAAAFSSDMMLNESQNESLVLKQHAITANISNVSISKEKSPYPDAIDTVSGEVVAEWQSGKAAITATASGSGRKTAYYAFSVDGITDAAAMEKLVANTVEWLLEKPNNLPVIQNFSDGDNESYSEIAPAAIKVTMNEGQTKNFSVLAEDPDGDPLTYNWLLNGTPVSTTYYFAFSPKYNESGSYNITIIVSDGQAEARAELIVTVLDTLECDSGKQAKLCPLQQGVCGGSNVTCGAAGKWPSCTAATYSGHSSKYEAVEGSCDGLDNDCDGLVDEGFGDVDGDKIADCVDKDNDNDDVEDGEDDLIGNESSINFTGGDKKLKIRMEDSEDEKEKAQKVKWVKLNESDKPLLQFRFNFSKGNILLRNLTIEKQKNDSKEGFTLVRGLDLKGKRKQVFVDRLINGSNAVCIKDGEVSAITEVTSGCSDDGETLLQCDFPKTGPPYARTGWTCGSSGGGGGIGNNPEECEPLFCQYVKEMQQYQIFGLKHSAVMEACTDADLDTYLPTGCSGGSDCNDNNNSINPAASEVCNGVDDNCNGQIDENRACNTAPILQNVGNKSVSENGALSFVVAATDSEGDSLAYNATSLPAGASFDNATAAFAWTPDFTRAGVYAVTFNISDGLAYDYEKINITVANTNRAPVFETVGNRTVLENATLSFTVSATDPDGDSLAQLFVNVPEKLASAQFSLATKEFKWVPTFDDSGSYTIWFTASDGQLSTNEFVNVTVVNVNRPPRFENLTNQTVFENSTLLFFMNATDPDNQALEVIAREIPAGSVFTGSVFSWKPTFDDGGSHGYETVFELSDGQDSVRASVNITVLNVNRIPSISSVSGNLTVNETEKVTAAISASDADGDTLTYSVNDSRFSQPSPGSFEWQTGFSSAGTYVVLATASDGSAAAQFAFTATVKNVNRAPRFENITNQTVLENSTLRFFANVTDPDNDHKSVLAEVPAKMAAAAFNGDTYEFSWRPTFDDAGSYTVIFLTIDGQYSVSAEVNVTVLNVNVAPVITNIHGSLTANETENLTVIIDASDSDGDTLTYSLNDSRFVQDIAAKSTFNWKTGYEDAGVYVVSASASDGSATAQFAFTATVKNVNRAPRFENITNQTMQENSELKFFANATDPDADSLQFTVEVPPAMAAAKFNANTMEFSWKASFDDAGAHKVRLIATDGQYSAAAEANVTVLNVNRAPAIMLLLVDPPELIMGEGEVKTFAADVSDADNDAVTVEWKVNGETASTEPQLTLAPKYNGSGTYTVELSVSDYAETTTTTMTLTVQDTLECGTGQTKLCQLQLGVCANSYETCAAPGQWPGCGAANYGGSYAPQEAFCSLQPNVNSCYGWCEGLDNDCDGTADEGRVCNTAPALAPAANATVKENETLQFTLAAADAENDVLAFTGSLPFLASLDGSTGAFTWTPGFTQAGSYTIEFAVSDGLLQDKEQINIAVANVNRAPEAKIVLEPAGQAGYYANEGELKLLKADASDPDGDDLYYAWWYLGNADWQQQGTKKLVSLSNYLYFFPNYTDGDGYNVHKFLLNVSDGNITVNFTVDIVVVNAQDCKPKAVQTEPCGSSIGACKQGQKNRTCGTDFKWSDWGDCLGEVKPQPADDCGTWEDDDCDGVVNNGCVESPDLATSWMMGKLHDASSGEIPMWSIGNASLTMRPYLYGEVLNLGDSDSPPATMVWYLNGRLMVKTTLPRINASQKLPVAAEMPYPPYEGMNNVSLVVDADNKIKEKSEKNNHANFPITVRYNETYRPWAKMYGEDYYKKLPTQEECENQGKCW